MVNNVHHIFYLFTVVVKLNLLDINTIIYYYNITINKD